MAGSVKKTNSCYAKHDSHARADAPGGFLSSPPSESPVRNIDSSDKSIFISLSMKRSRLARAIQSRDKTFPRFVLPRFK